VKHAVILIIVVGLLSGPAPGWAEPDPVKLFQKAVERFGAADFEGSLALLQRATAGVGSRDSALRAKILLYKGINLAVMGNERAARQSFREAQLQDPAVELDPDQFKPTIMSLFRAERRLTLGRLDISADITGAGVWLDGAPAGKVPLTRYLRPGRIKVEVRDQQGRPSYIEVVALEAGQVLRLALRLRRGNSVASDSAKKAGSGRPARVATWAVGGVGVACLVAGAVLGGLARSDHEAWLDLTEQGKDPVAWEERRSTGKDKQLAANVLLGVGGGLAAAAVALFFVEPGWAGDDADAAGAGKVRTVKVGAGPGLGLGVNGRF
jgi:hypothetical protein